MSLNDINALIRLKGLVKVVEQREERARLEPKKPKFKGFKFPARLNHR
jgi:hypothetical protein